MLSGTEGGLSLPDLALWRHGGEKSWATPLDRRLHPKETGDSYQCQLRHFGAVIRDAAEPQVPASEATRTLATIAAILASVESGREERVHSPQGSATTIHHTAGGAA
jgi:predicted dehydrogenase